MKKENLIIVIFVLLLPAFAFSQNVTGIKAIFNNGQTFLTWNNIPNLKNVTYYVYKSINPFKNAYDFSKENFIGKVGDSSSYNYRLSQILNKHLFFRIENTGKMMDASKGLYVHPATADGSYYYALIPQINGRTIISIIPEENILKNPINEEIENISGVYQMTLDSLGKSYDIYVHWVSKYGNIIYPSMTTTYNYAYNFSIQRKGRSNEHPLLIFLHAKGSNFLSNSIGTDNNEEWVLSIDDYMPNEIQHTFWYGYHNNFNFYKPDSIPKKGIVNDYTVRRVKWTLEWVINNFPIDSNRVYLTGGSMGGGGSILIGMTMPNRIAAIYSNIPKFDYSFVIDPNPNHIYNEGKPRRKLISRLWGSTEKNLMTNDNIPVYYRLNMAYLSKKFRKKSLPFIIAFNGKNDNVVGWAEKIPFYTAYNESRLGGYFFWDSRSHDTTSIREWLPEMKPEILYKFALNKSYPAFSNCSVNYNPGNGLVSNGDSFGTINGYLSWDDFIIDRKNYYEIHIHSRDLNTINKAIPSMDSIYVDVTLRRLQNLQINNQNSYYFQDVNNDGKVIQDGYFEGDYDNLLTIKKFLVTKGGNKLIVIPVDAESKH